MSDYFKAISNPDPKVKKQVDIEDKETEFEDTPFPPSQMARQDTTVSSKKQEKKKQTPLPNLKVTVSIQDFRVAVIENVDTPQPQALTLKVMYLVRLLILYLIILCV